MKKSKFKFIDYSKPGKGVKKGDGKKFTFGNFFPLLKRKFFDLSKVNLLWLIVNLPLLVGFVGLSGKFDTYFSTPSNPVYSLLDGVMRFDTSPATLSLYGTIGGNTTASSYGTVTIVLFCIAALALFTFGPANTGIAYIMREFTKEEYTEIGHDFFRTIKKNLLPSIALGIVDVIFIVLLTFDIVFFRYQSQSFAYSMFFYISLFLCVIYFVMRFYMYPMLVTFKLSIGKIFKNSFIFAIVGFKRNILGVIGIALTIFLNYILYMVYLPLGGLLPFFITIALVNFIGVYASWPNIKRLMIDPYYNTDEGKNDDDKNEEEPIFTDIG